MSSTAVYGVKGMMCGGCVNTVRETLEGLDVVQSAVVDLEAKQATVVFHGAPDHEAVVAALKAKDYPATPKV